MLHFPIGQEFVPRNSKRKLPFSHQKISPCHFIRLLGDKKGKDFARTREAEYREDFESLQ
jgi:hypothetical protein